jgi:S1-C subfamily serine protease
LDVTTAPHANFAKCGNHSSSVYKSDIAVKEAALLGVMVCPADGGLRVTSVRSGSPAARAAILPGDIVTSIDGTPVRISNDIETAMAANTSGTVKVGYLIQGNFLVEHEAKVR